MRTDAQAHAEEDRQAREKADKLNAADSLIFQTEKQLKDYGDKLPADKKETIETAANELKEAHKAQDLDQIDSASEKLNAAWQAASQEMYQASQQQGATADQGSAEGTGDGSQGGGADDVTDVEYEEVDDHKKE